MIKYTSIASVIFCLFIVALTCIVDECQAFQTPKYTWSQRTIFSISSVQMVSTDQTTTTEEDFDPFFVTDFGDNGIEAMDDKGIQAFLKEDHHPVEVEKEGKRGLMGKLATKVLLLFATVVCVAIFFK